jgi:thiamine pyrophosphate-dependent acetolactate synthase large subunit-like protein
MGKKSVADLLVDTLVSRGVSRVYGVAGDSLHRSRLPPRPSTP